MSKKKSESQVIRAYHGNQGGIDTERLHAPMWFTTSREDAEYYAGDDGYVVVVDLDIKNPYVLRPGEEANTVLRRWQDLQIQDYDGIYDRGVGDWIPFSNSQIKVVSKDDVMKENFADGKVKGKREHEKKLAEDLRAWFGKGKKGGAGGGGWDRYNTKGERIGKCGEKKPGEGKPKCLSKSKAASLRASGGKKAIAAAVNKKRREDPNPNRKGAADMVSNKVKKTNESYQYDESNLMYIYNPDSGRLMKAVIQNRDEQNAKQQGYRDTPEQALRVHNIIRSKFNPNKFVQKQDFRGWVEVFPYGKLTDKKITENNQEKLYRHHQQIRKDRGLPDPDEYLRQSKTKLIELILLYNPNADIGFLELASNSELKKIYNDVKEKYPLSEIKKHKNNSLQVFIENFECPHCHGPMYPEDTLTEESKKDACYHKVKSRYKIWPSAYASGALVKCRKVGASNWGNKSKKTNEEVELDEACWKGYEKKGMKTMFGKKYPNCVKKTK
jgi:hypothetical protein